MSTLWKQEHELHVTFRSIHECFADDWFLLPYELKLQEAHATVLHHAGILDADERSALVEALHGIAGKFLGRPAPQTEAEDLHTWIEVELTRRAGDAGRKIHTARSRNDQIATLTKMYAIDRGEALADGLATLESALCRRAVDWSDLQFPLQTHAQFAAPGSVGAWAMRYATSLERTRRHLNLLVREWSRFCPLGSGAVAGSSIPIDRGEQARLLGFDAPAPNSIDATSTRDECLQLLAVIAHAALHLQSLAADGLAFCQTPFRWLTYPPGLATGSSMMPNKSNPDALELMRGEASLAIGAHVDALLILKGLPSGYNRDLQCLKPVLRQAVERMGRLLSLACAFVDHAEFDTARLAEAMRHGDIGATLRMEARVLEGEALRDAHHAEAGGARSDGASASRTNATTDANAYRTTGGASPEEAKRTARELLERLNRNV